MCFDIPDACLFLEFCCYTTETKQLWLETQEEKLHGIKLFFFVGENKRSNFSVAFHSKVFKIPSSGIIESESTRYLSH